jgi:hypothetical protein
VRINVARCRVQETAVVLLPTRDCAVELPEPPAATLDGVMAHELQRLAVV